MSLCTNNLSADLTTLQEVLASLRVDVDSILEMRLPEPNTGLVDISKDTVLAALLIALVAA